MRPAQQPPDQEAPLAAKIEDINGHRRKPLTFIPSYDELRTEDEELDPKMVFTVSDAAGNVVRRINGSPDKGLHRVTWDLRYPSSRPTDISDKKPGRWGMAPVGPLVAPGTYSVTMAKKIAFTRKEMKLMSSARMQATMVARSNPRNRLR